MTHLGRQSPGPFSVPADVLRRLARAFWDIGIKCLDHWATSWLQPYFFTLYYRVDDVAAQVDQLNDWADAVARGITDRIPFWELRDQVRGLSSNIRWIMDDPGRFIRETIGRNQGFSYWQYSTWDRLIYWMLHYRARPLWLFFIDPWGYIRDIFFGRVWWFRDFLDRTDDWLRERIGSALGLLPGQYNTWEMIPAQVLHEFFPWLYYLWRNPWYTIKEEMRKYAPSLVFLIDDPGGWLRELLRSWDNELPLLLDDPSYWVVRMIDDFIDKHLAEFSETVLYWTERILLYLW